MPKTKRSTSALTLIVIDTCTDDLSEVKEKKIQLRSIDSMKFMVSNLDSLTNNFFNGGQQMIGFKDYSKACRADAHFLAQALHRLKGSSAQYELLTRKGVYPYKYMTS